MSTLDLITKARIQRRTSDLVKSNMDDNGNIYVDIIDTNMVTRISKSGLNRIIKISENFTVQNDDEGNANFPVYSSEGEWIGFIKNGRYYKHNC